MEPKRRSWVPGADGSGFGLENLPYGVIVPAGKAPRPAVRVGDYALDLSVLADAGLLSVPGLEPTVLSAPTLNRFLELGPEVWSATRARLVKLLDADRGACPEAETALRALIDVDAALPVAVGDYVDFFSSIEHATNAGRILRPGAEALHPNWRRLPVAYHGRAGSFVVGGTPIRRPRGQRAPAEPGLPPTFGPERKLDFELELAFVTGCDGHIFGFALLNDWSAREIQRWESVPLGPFLGKSFATSLASWIVPTAALGTRRVTGVPQDPAPLEHLRVAEPRGLDVELEIALLPAGSDTAEAISATNARGLYWSAEQQLAHATSGGAVARTGDLFASGTISGSEPGTQGCLLELTADGREPLEVAGAWRSYLEDGDTVIMRGRSGGHPGQPLISFGELSGVVLPAR